MFENPDLTSLMVREIMNVFETHLTKMKSTDALQITVDVITVVNCTVSANLYKDKFHMVKFVEAISTLSQELIMAPDPINNKESLN